MNYKSTEPGGTVAGLETQLETLEVKQRQLTIALEEFEHQNRRVGDRLERAGGVPRDLEQQRSMLRENIEITKSELTATEAEIETLRRRLEM